MTTGIKRSQLISLFLVNGFIYALSALYYCFVQLYIGEFKSAVEVGTLLSLGQIVSVVAPMLWGILADKARYKNTVLLVVTVGSAACYWALSLNDSYWWLALTICGEMLFMSAFGGLIDTITLEYCYSKKVAYGPIRLAGTLFYGIIAFVLSLYIKDNIRLIFPVYIALAAVTCVSMFFIPKIPGMASTKKKFNLAPLFKQKTFMVIIVLSVVANFAWGYYISFFPSYLTNELHAPDWVWGLNVMLTVVGEIPFFLMFTRLFDRLGIKKILVSAIVITAVRCLLLGVCTQSWALLTASAVTGVSISLFTYCGSVYITGNIAEELHASAQTFMYAFGQGLPKVAATFLGGFLTESIGTGKTLLWCSAASALTLIASFFLLPKKMGISTAAEQK